MNLNQKRKIVRSSLCACDACVLYRKEMKEIRKILRLQKFKLSKEQEQTVDRDLKTHGTEKLTNFYLDLITESKKRNMNFDYYTEILKYIVKK